MKVMFVHGIIFFFYHLKNRWCEILLEQVNKEVYKNLFSFKTIFKFFFINITNGNGHKFFFSLPRFLAGAVLC